MDLRQGKGLMGMDEMKRNMRRVFWFLFILFSLVVINLGRFLLIESPSVVTHPTNTRLKTGDRSIIRGSIYDSAGRVLAESEGQKRVYPYGNITAHVTGYNMYGKAGVEAKYNFRLESLHMEVLQRVRNIIDGTPLQGNSVTLTLDAQLQTQMHDALGNRRGAVVVIEPSTGKILSMVSKPDYNPENIEQTWGELSTDAERAALINRASQGLYPPGSIFKILTAAAAYEFLPNYAEFEYECTGLAQFGPNAIHCVNGTAHGRVDIRKAFAVSCNSFFATVGFKIGAENLRAVAERALFNTAYPYLPGLELPVEYTRSSFALGVSNASDENSVPNSELIETAIGQGRTLATPLHMAMLTAAAANGGIMMRPYMVDHELTDTGGIVNKSLPAKLCAPFTFEESEWLKSLMVAAVTEGTASGVSIPGVAVAAKTGTAQNGSGEDHGWFVAFAPADKPQAAVCVLLENSGGARYAQPIARQAIEYVLALGSKTDIQD
ncbi:MAG: penicillin-binding protein 2 [Clostridiales bacterium]|jgi:peptidoglycan glycosyltransferase|nr:penicillin-binding protein 2 [Clostridiales bacterium]